MPGVSITIPQLNPDNIEFPSVDTALDEPNGLLAMEGDLSPNRVIQAYYQGIFPWFDEDQPILWWSPNPRAVLLPSNLKVSRSLQKSIRNRGYQVSVDQAFMNVIQQCKERVRHQQTGTWITSDMVNTYHQLHLMGYAHSVECWHQDELVGGLYGIAIGALFFGESMFSIQTDASKVAFAYIVRQLAAAGCPLIDCQVSNTHMQSLGSTEIPRNQFLHYLKTYLHCRLDPEQSPWKVSPPDD